MFVGHWRALMDQLIREAKTRDTQSKLTEEDERALRDDVLLLLEKRLGVDRKTRLQGAELHVSASVWAELLRDTDALLREMPLAYVLREADFAGDRYLVTPDVLIPRPDSEILLEAAVEAVRELALREHTECLRIVDLGTGSGILLVALVKRLLEAEWLGDKQVEALGVDISPAALKVAETNARRLLGTEVQDAGAVRWRFLEHDGLPRGEVWSVILSNPPYITSDEMLALDRSVQAYEPALALDGGPAGDELFRRVLGDLPEALEAGGYLLVEHGYQQAEAYRKLAADVVGLGYLGVRPDLAGRDRVSEWKRTQGAQRTQEVQGG